MPRHQGLRLVRLVRVLFVCSIFPALLRAQTDANQDGAWQRPPEALARLVDAPQVPQILISPDAEHFLLLSHPELQSIEELAERELRLAGLRIKPATNGGSRSSGFTGITFRRFGSPEEHTMTGLPAGVRIEDVEWAPDGRSVALSVVHADRIELWLADPASGAARRIGERPLNGVFGAPCSWMPDSRGLVCLTVPPDRGPEPSPPAAPSGPVLQENTGDSAPVRTYQDLLGNPFAEALFRHYGSAHLVRIGMDGTETVLAGPSLFTSATPSPDGAYLLVTQLQEPFSYLVPFSYFARKTVVLDRNGLLVFTVADLPASENVPTGFGSVPTGRRSVTWRADAPATLTWTEARDNGDARADAEIRDEVFLLDAPFAASPTSLIRLSTRYAGLSWLGDRRALVSESWWSTRRNKVHLLDLQGGTPASRVLLDYSSEDRYAHPGQPVFRWTDRGTRTVATTADGSSIFLIADGASEEGDRPFLRALHLADGTTEERFRSSSPYYEVPVALLDRDANRLLTRRESEDEPANYFLRDLSTGEAVAVTAFPHPYPDLAIVQKELITYEREDGVTLTADLYLPAGYEPQRDGPLPALIWAYPVEFKSADAAGQVSGSPHRFKTISYWGAVPFVTMGYAVLDRTSMPIVGEANNEPNDTFVRQLVANARAAILEGVRRGVVDPDRVAVGGHSYGAFMTANLLAHSDLFRAGIARSGAYNRTLTPFGFQREERTYWQAPDVYNTMSPFMHAHRVNEPILLIHGEADNNSGTFPIQSERFYAALKGHGAIARLVLLPHESHGYRARESLLHMLYEQNRWLDLHVKNAPPRPSPEGVPFDAGSAR